ncbi:hypothetical protein C7K59_09770 [Escherichia coli]|nr:hypothetical protein C7K59_09770 [Escherichia coli]
MLTVNTHGFATGDDFHSGIPLKTEDKSENRCDVVVRQRFAFGWNSPHGIVNINFRPAGISEFTGTNKNQ